MAQSQRWNADDYANNARFVATLAEDLIDLLAPTATERILDLGCGDGALTLKLMNLGAEVVGIDSSEDLLLAANTAGVKTILMDAQSMTFDKEFDAVFSNAALHWMRDSTAVIAGVKRALKPGGRFVGEFGGHGNVAAICTALMAVLKAHGVDGGSKFPWFFPSPEQYALELSDAGFVVNQITLIPRPTYLPSGMQSWLNTFANPFFIDIDHDERDSILDEVVALLSTSLLDSQGRWTADYVRLKFAAALPAN